MCGQWSPRSLEVTTPKVARLEMWMVSVRACFDAIQGCMCAGKSLVSTTQHLTLLIVCM